MRALLQSAFILHRRPYRNTSVLLEVFSQERGRLGLVARGAAAPKSRLTGLLQPFAPLLLSWSGAVSYTHLDVYKRQTITSGWSFWALPC